MVRSDLDLANRRLRIEKSKALKDRIVHFSPAITDALKAYLAIRGPAGVEQVFIHRHVALKASYCSRRLRTHG